MESGGLILRIIKQWQISAGRRRGGALISETSLISASSANASAADLVVLLLEYDADGAPGALELLDLNNFDVELCKGSPPQHL